MDGEGFLGRWSARKQAAREEVQEAVVDQPAEVTPDPEKTDAEILEEFGLKDPDDLQAGDDFSGFMSGAIPERLRNRALRKLWLTNPVLANVDELVDYGEDFTDAATVVENLQTAYRVGKGFLRREEIEADETEGDSSEDVETASVADELDEADTDSAAFSPDENADADADQVQAIPNETQAAAAAAAQNPSQQAEVYPPSRPRRMVFRSA